MGNKLAFGMVITGVFIVGVGVGVSIGKRGRR